MKPEFINSLVLAYLGDAYLELLVREYLVKETNITKPNDYQKAAVALVSAQSQMDFVNYALENHLFEEREITMYKRGRNTKSGTKNETAAHRHSTGFEAIIGHLYLEDNKERIFELFKIYQNYFEQQSRN